MEVREAKEEVEVEAKVVEVIKDYQKKKFRRNSYWKNNKEICKQFKIS
jgi:hypothetical protein